MYIIFSMFQIVEPTWNIFQMHDSKYIRNVSGIIGYIILFNIYFNNLKIMPEIYISNTFKIY